MTSIIKADHHLAFQPDNRLGPLTKYPVPSLTGLSWNANVHPTFVATTVLISAVRQHLAKAMNGLALLCAEMIRVPVVRVAAY